jgi:nucleoside-diphosphate-sugar epimerase
LLIVGCGDVGLRLIQRLRVVRGPAQLSICATARRSAQCEAIRKAGAVPLQADLDQPCDVARLAALGQHAVILVPPAEGGTRDHRSRRLVAAWAAATRSHPALRPAFVYLSTTGVYGDCGGAWVDECSAAKPHHDRSRRRWDAEEHWRSRLGAARLRVPGIYADNRLPLARIAQGLPGIDPSEDSYSNRIHAEDLAQLAWLALFRARPGRLYTVADDEPLGMGQWFDAVAAAFGLPTVPRLSRAQVQSQVSPTMWSFMTESRRLRNTRMHRELRPQLIAPRARDYLLSISGKQLQTIHPPAPGLQSEG